MRIAISGTHFMGKSTLIEDFIKRHPDYQSEIEPYYKLQDEQSIPSLDGFLEQLDYSIKQLNECANEDSIIFDRCPVDFLAYAMCILDQDDLDVNTSEVSERFPEMKEALNHLDLIVFLPMSKENPIEYPGGNPAYRRVVDTIFKKIYRDDICDIFPQYGHPKIIEISGDRMTRIKKLESYLV